MANIRICYDNVFDDAVLYCPDGMPSMPAESLQSAGRLQVARLQRISAVTGLDTSGAGADIDCSPLITAASISFWAYRTGNIDTSALVRLIGDDTSTDGELSVRYTSSNTVVGRYITPGGATSNTSSAAVDLNTWQHWAVTWEAGGLVTLYKNSSVIGTVDPSSDTSIGLSTATVRLDVDATNVRLCRLRLDARCLSSDEITALMAHQYVHDGALIDRWAFAGSLTGERGNVLDGSSTYVDGPDVHASADFTQIKGVWSSNQTINMVALVRHTLPATASVRVRLFSDTGYTTAIYDSGDVAPYTGTRTGDYVTTTFYFAAVTTARSFSIEVDNGSDTWDLARVVMGSYWEPGCNVSTGMALTFAEAGQYASRTEGGALLTEAGAIYRRLALQFSRITPAERDSISALLYTAGGAREVFVAVLPNNSNSQREMDYSLLGVIGSPPLVHPVYGNYTVSMTVEET